MNQCKLKTAIFSITAFATAATPYAGTMGSAPPSLARPYIAGEATYTWRQIDAPNINSFTSTLSNQPWGFRVSAGLLRLYTEKLGLTAELGGGYYGKTSISSPISASMGNISVNGFDVLVGLLYKLEYLDVFGEIGFMGENTRSDFTRYNLVQLLNGNLIRGRTRTRIPTTELLPELRVGGIYNLRNNLGVTLAYMHTFGSTMKYEIKSKTGLATGIDKLSDVNVRNPTLNSILLGLRYYII